MKNNLLCIAVLTLISTGAAQAQSAGSFTLRGGATLIAPQVSSGDLSSPSFAGTKVNVLDASQISGGINYMLTDNIAVDLPLGIPFKHQIIGAGAIANTGKLADVEALPVTMLLQYKAGSSSSDLRPFVGVGLTMVKFSNTRSTAALSGLTGGTTSNPTTMSMKDANGSTYQLGVAARLGGRWTLEVSATKVMLKTIGKLSTGQTIGVTLNPVAFSTGLGYTF